MAEILPVRTTRLDAQRTYDRLSRVYDLAEGIFERAAIRNALDGAGEATGFEIAVVRRIGVSGLPAEIVRARKPVPGQRQ